MHKRETVHSPIFFGKIIEIERFALRAAILHECQNYLGGEKNRGTVLKKHHCSSRSGGVTGISIHAFYHSLIKKLHW